MVTVSCIIRASFVMNMWRRGCASQVAIDYFRNLFQTVFGDLKGKFINCSLPISNHIRTGRITKTYHSIILKGISVIRNINHDI